MIESQFSTFIVVGVAAVPKHSLQNKNLNIL